VTRFRSSEPPSIQPAGARAASQSSANLDTGRTDCRTMRGTQKGVTRLLGDYEAFHFHGYNEALMSRFETGWPALQAQEPRQRLAESVALSPWLLQAKELPHSQFGRLENSPGEYTSCFRRKGLNVFRCG